MRFPKGEENPQERKKEEPLKSSREGKQREQIQVNCLKDEEMKKEKYEG